ncbi:MAG: stalk domain-containing protein [Paenibacillus sp.]|uniref:stalk domain-containing protein n=1 Tax=Paenibacillus sp. TaxID=58172 RepID=UPI0029102610|nr:stalk domain-containing protein [Paenibacillus sp.]MDU4696849.1 stalk domain-containing protein [Paenibacillus sp.]
MRSFLKHKGRLLLAALLGFSSFVAAQAPALADGSGGPVSDAGRTLLRVDVYAGTGQAGWTEGTWEEAEFRSPGGLLRLSDGRLLVADTANQVIRQVKDGVVSPFAGIPFPVKLDERNEPVGGYLDGPLKESAFQMPSGLAADASGNIYVADTGNHAIRKITADGQVQTLAGNGVLGLRDGERKNARFHSPEAIAVTGDGIVYVADTLNHVIRKITTDGEVTTLNATSERVVMVHPGLAVPAGDYQDGSLSQALFNEPSGLALDDKGNLYVSDRGNHLIRYIDFAADTVSTVAGKVSESMYSEANPTLTASGGYLDGDAGAARFNGPAGLAWTQDGLLIADSLNHTIRLLRDQKVTTLVGARDGVPGSTGHTEASAAFSLPVDVTVEEETGAIWVADALNHQVRVLRPYSLPETVAGRKGPVLFYEQNAVADTDQLLLQQGRLDVPLRLLAEAVGYTVTFNSAGDIVMQGEGRSVSLRVGKSEATVTVNSTGDISRLTLAAAPYVSGGKVYIPLRGAGVLLNKEVNWLSEARLAVMRDK